MNKELILEFSDQQEFDRYGLLVNVYSLGNEAEVRVNEIDSGQYEVDIDWAPLLKFIKENID
jgi:hypothetical protein